MRHARVDWSGLAARLAGRLSLPGSPGFGSVRRQFVGTGVDLLPAAVARCAGPADVACALRFADEHDIDIAVRSGGHSYADHSSTSGLLLDLSGLDRVVTGPGKVLVGAGTTLERLVLRLADADRMTPTGSCPTVGIGGSALAGGFGLLGRQYGLTADQVLAARMVLADGRVATVDDGREPDLFWALRGAGGGNFGVVTSFVLRTWPARGLTAFYARWPLRCAVQVVRQWQQWAPQAADEITASLALICPDLPDDPATVELFGAAQLPAEAVGGEFAAVLSAIGTAPEQSSVQTMTGAAAARYRAGLIGRSGTPYQVARGPFAQPGHQYVASEFFDQPLPDQSIEELVALLEAGRVYGQHRELEFAAWGGAYGRVPPQATAFAHRGQRFLVRHTALTGSRADATRREAAGGWVRESWTVLHRHGTGRAYSGYPDPGLPGWASAYYGENLARLGGVKARYDPGNRFRFAQSIPLPASIASGDPSGLPG